MRRPCILLLAALLATPILGPPASAALSACRDSHKDETYVHTLHLEVKFDKKVYAIGETVKVTATVTHTNEDPLGTEHPIPNFMDDPVAGATVGVGLYIGRVYLPGGGITDENGVAIVEIKLEDYAPPNKVVDASSYAKKWITWHPPCNDYYEDGWKPLPKAFRTKD